MEAPSTSAASTRAGARALPLAAAGISESAPIAGADDAEASSRCRRVNMKTASPRANAVATSFAWTSRARAASAAGAAHTAGPK